MGEHQLPDWPEVAQAADRMLLSSSPAELHGALCGWLAAGGASDPDRWLADVLANPDVAAPSPGGVLQRLHEATVEQFGDDALGFQLLLPDAEPVGLRVDALLAWCRAFLGGFGLAAGDPVLSDEGREALRDIADLGAADVEAADAESDEQALAEIEEYVRMAVLVLHADGALAPRARRRLH